MAPGILVIDRNEAFATMLKQMLETDGGYEVRMAQKGSDALALLQEESFALTIIDMDLDPDDLDIQELIPRVRQMQPSMRLMLIPLMGESLPSEVEQSDIQGTLSKPFFADDLLPRIEDALNKAVHLAEPQPDPDLAPEPHASAEVEAILYQLAREIYADAVLLLSIREGKERLIAHASSEDDKSTMKLANLSMGAIRAAQAAARFLGQPDRPFEHNMFETDSLRLYAMSLPGEMLLTVVTPASTPLGTIRHNLRRAARELSQLALG
jgi:CheY-like chemotaxis protein/predicted regulator of Ras-like GTPase activity (Roadblock/LC7/MglB family)